MQLPVAETEFLRFEEKRVVQEREGVEDVEAELPNITSATPFLSS